MSTDMEFDPERRLWKPGRRSFLFMFVTGIVAPKLPEVNPHLHRFVAVGEGISMRLVTKWEPRSPKDLGMDVLMAMPMLPVRIYG